MKKFLLTLMAAMSLPLAMQADVLSAQQLQGVLNSNAPLKAAFTQRQQAPARADLAANQRIMGAYDTDDVTTGGGLGLTSFAGTIPIATILTPEDIELFQGGKIVAMRVGLAASTEVSRVFVTPITDGSTMGETTEWSCNVSAEGWNTVTLETPYEINLGENDQLMIGFDYKQTSSNYPISAVEVGEIHESYCYLTYQGNTGWYNVSLSSYGNLSVQCIVESDNFPDYMIVMKDLDADKYIKKGTEGEFDFEAKNFGSKTLTAGNYTFDYSIDGKKVGTLTGAVDLENSFILVEGTFSTDDLATGKHVLSVWAATMNGEAIAEEDITKYEAEFTVYSDAMPRQRHLVEQCTSSSCTYCPLGTGLLEVLDGLRDDISWVSIHGTLNSSYPDPYHIAQCDTLNAYLGLTSWPSGALDRVNAWNGEEGLLGSLGYYAQYHEEVAEAMSEILDGVTNAMPTFASINIKSTVDADRKAEITVSGEVPTDFNEMMGEDARLCVYLVEDSLVSKQLNMGKWESSYVHNGVFRQALPGVAGTALNINGTTYENTFNYTIPEDWNTDQMSVVAFICRPITSGDYNDMFVNNAEEARLGHTSGINEILNDGNSDVVPVGYYDIMGRQHDSLQQGLNIVKMSNGTAVKVMIK